MTIRVIYFVLGYAFSSLIVSFVMQLIRQNKRLKKKNIKSAWNMACDECGKEEYKIKNDKNS